MLVFLTLGVERHLSPSAFSILGQEAQAGGLPWWFWLLVIIVVIVLVWWWLSRKPAEAAPPPATKAPATEAPAIEALAKVAPATEAPASMMAEAEKPVPDDLTVIEGIGPKISALLQAAGITTFAKLAATETSQIQKILTAAGLRLADPGTWAEQARLAAGGDLAGLQALQDRLKGGRKTD
jgi:predicted flap endonuclease-1-like 5' DNA nuclease